MYFMSWCHVIYNLRIFNNDYSPKSLAQIIIERFVNLSQVASRSTYAFWLSCLMYLGHVLYVTIEMSEH